MEYYRFIKMKLLLVGIILFLFSSSVVSQSKSSIRHPKNFNVQTEKSTAGLAKRLYDTLQYKSFTKIKEDFVVNSGCGSYGADQHQINIASDPRGGFLCAWNDDRAGDRQVNAQLFDNNGNRLGSVIHVSERNANWNSEPHIAFNARSNEYVVLWAGSGYDIQFQRIKSSGEPIGHNITANQLYSTNTNNPSAASDSSGNIIVTWTADLTCCMSEIPYCRIFNKDGIPITDQWSLVPSGTTNVSSFGWDDRIAADSIGRCVIVWSSFINGRSRIVFQSVNRTGNLYAEPVIVSDPADSSDNYFPTVASTKGGDFLILWGSDKGVSGRIFHADSGFVTPQLTIAHTPQSWITCGASSDDQNKFFVAWFSDRGYGQIVSTQGQLSGPAIPLSFSTTIPWWSYPRLSKGLFNRLSMVYGGYVRTQMDVMLQSFDLSFNPIGSSVKVADDGCSAWQTNPVVKYNQFGKSLIVWEDQRNGYHDLYGQVLDESGDPLSTNILISDSAISKRIAQPAIASDNDGNFLVSFSGGDYSSRNLILQKVSASGKLIGSNVMITNDYFYDYDQLYNEIQKNDAGDILLCWYASGYSAVYTQRLHPDLSPQSGRKLIFNSSLPSPKNILGISTNSKFNNLVMWVDYNYQTNTAGKVLKAMIINEQGTVIRDSLVVAQIANERSFYRGVCGIDENNNMVFVWNEFDTYGYEFRMNVKRVYATDNVSRTDSFSIDNLGTRMQIVKFDNKKVCVAWDAYDKINSLFFDDNIRTYIPVRLHTIPSFVYSLGGLHNVYHADIFGSNLLISYESSQNSDAGYDVYTNVQKIEQFKFQDDPPSFENATSVYPNPTSQNVKLQYEITQQTNVTIAVYNILGQRIADIENGSKAPGLYTVQFPTDHLPAGIYFFLYRGAKSYTKKFIVIK